MVTAKNAVEPGLIHEDSMILPEEEESWKGDGLQTSSMAAQKPVSAFLASTDNELLILQSEQVLTRKELS